MYATSRQRRRHAAVLDTEVPGLSPAEEKALRITNYFETGNRGALGFERLAGNFDGQGISFGVMQWNIGSGTLQPLLLELARKHPDRFDAVFGPHAAPLRALLERGVKAEQLRWAVSIDAGGRAVVEPWKTYFQRLGADPAFQAVQLRRIRTEMDQAIALARKYGLRTERGLAFMFDVVTQHGPGWDRVKGRGSEIERRRSEEERRRGGPLGERELLLLIAAVIAESVNPKWREVVRQRRLAIANGRGTYGRTPIDLDGTFGLSDVAWTAGAAAIAPSAPVTSTPVPVSPAASESPVLSPLAGVTRPLRNDGRMRKGQLFGIVVHTTGTTPALSSRRDGGGRPALEYALDYFLQARKGFPHYVIDYDGAIHATCDERREAWHAGWPAGIFAPPWQPPGWWSRVWASWGAKTPRDLLPPGARSPNAAHLGIEILAQANDRYTDAQIVSLARLVVDIERRQDLHIPSAPSPSLLGHEDMMPVEGPTGRADRGGGWDPGAHRVNPRFSWARLWTEIGAVRSTPRRAA